MISYLEIDEFLKEAEGHLMLDVRSEGEYEYGHIPHAVNLPLFNNEERKIVGTAYKQQGREEAILQGLDMAGKKMAGFLRFAREQKKSERLFVHCWRGGMRSESMAWLMSLYGFRVSVLKGGYKSYRHRVLDVLSEDFNFIVIGGKTGSGKTEVLRELKKLGEQVIDLEALAQHKGSAFGALGHPPQPSSEQFENLMAEELKLFNRKKAVWLEDESRTIGKVFLDINFWIHIRQAPLFVIDLPLEKRLEKLVNEYGSFSVKDLKESLTKIQKRLGNEQWKSAMEALGNGDIQQAAQIALQYYDKAYEKGIALKETKEIFRITFEENNPANIAASLQNEANKKYGV